MKTLRIDIVSDVACPWCAIGYARLKQAMDQLSGELDFTVEWHAFELNPDMALDGEPILAHLSRKYGRSPEEMEANQAQMMTIAEGLGLNFAGLQQRYSRNTFDAHRLLKWAREQGRQTELKLAFFEAYFGKAENISDKAVLTGCVEAVGLDAEMARQILDSDEYGVAVRADEERYQQAGVTAVPAFIVNQRYLISGAQEPETLVNAFREIAEDRIETSQA
ncbi:DsbA family oxidoreductase [Marinobacter halodurans]|uniref:DsbA family oxidoreductase n=1 Tax=Marinobacter halodurans TaxID=2528979 RepID=A0ABY1ZGQ0_9GAMM|nr:DsbA family oxidoreductase [Marinobacter halodurans]TBW50747.1 DsbA family oxidoreductase [Marinobacter halodurans]